MPRKRPIFTPGEWPPSMDPYTSPPPSIDPLAVIYRETLEPQLLDLLLPMSIPFWLTMVYVQLPSEDTEKQIPIIVVFAIDDVSVSHLEPVLQNLWDSEPKYSPYICFVTRAILHDYLDEHLPFNIAPYNTILDEARSGMSIGHGSDGVTCGGIFEKQGEYYGLTCAHLFKDKKENCVGLTVGQPSMQDLRQLIQRSDTYRNNKKIQLERTTGPLKEKRQLEFDQATAICNELANKRFSDPVEYTHAMSMGVVIRAEYGYVKYEGRFCQLDYALFRIQSRLPDPGSYFMDDPPTTGFLSTLNWSNDPTTVGKLSFDQFVKKRGQATGVTYGVVAGVAFCGSDGEGNLLREFYVLPEKSCYSLHHFSEKGDSGSFVVTNAGVAVGMVLGGYLALLDGYKAVIRREDRYFDVGNYPHYRKEDGSIDFTGLCTHILQRPLDIVQDLTMVMNRIGDLEMKLVQ